MVSPVLLWTAFSMVLPVGQVRFGHALIGGVTATLLWELRHYIMSWCGMQIAPTSHRSSD